MKGLVTLLVSLLILLGCQNNTVDLTAEQRAAISKEVNQIVTSIYDLANKKDPSIYNNFSDSTTGIFTGTEMASWEAHKKQMIDFFSGPDKIEGSIEIVETNVLSSTAAVVVGKYKIRVTNTAGETFNSPTTYISYVFNKIDGQWKIVHFHDSEPKQ